MSKGVPVYLGNQGGKKKMRLGESGARLGNRRKEKNVHS